MSDDNSDYGQLRFDDGDSDGIGGDIGGTAGLHADKTLSKSSKKADKGGKGDKGGKPDRLQKLSDSIGDFKNYTGVLQRLDQKLPVLVQTDDNLVASVAGLSQQVGMLTTRADRLDSRFNDVSSSVHSEVESLQAGTNKTTGDLVARVDQLSKAVGREHGDRWLVIAFMIFVMLVAIWFQYRVETKLSGLSALSDKVVALQVQAARQSLAGKVFLTPDEVLDYSGLPEAVFHKAVVDKRLTVYIVPNGKETEERFRRSDVDKFLKDYKP